MSIQDPQFGGTGTSSYTTGDISYASATNTLSNLAIGTTGQVLTVAGGFPSWAAPAPNVIGTFDSQAASANGLVAVGLNIYAQSASATNPGMMNIGAQTLGGFKSFAVDSDNIIKLESDSQAGFISFKYLGTTKAQWIGYDHVNQKIAMFNATSAKQLRLNDDGTGSYNGGAFSFTGALSASNLSGTNTGDQTITLTGDITGSGTGSFATTYNGVVPATKGGTAQSTYATGDTLYASASNTLSKLAIGSTNQVLTVTGGVPVWAAVPSPTGTANSVPYFNGSGVLSTTTGFKLTDTLNSYVMGFASSGGTFSSSGRGSRAEGWARGDGPNGAKSITASGNGSLAFGESYSNNITASGSSTFAGGSVQNSIQDTIASIDGAFAFGDGVQVSGMFATGFGLGNTVSSYGALVAGRFASATGTTGSWVSTDPLFVLGNGTSLGSPANALSVRKDGITTMPAYGAGVAQFSSTGVISSTAPGTSGNILTSNGSAWVSQAPAGGSVALSSITAATGSNSINNGANAQTWAWNTLAAGNGLTLTSSDSTQSGKTLVVESTGASNSAQTLRVNNAGTGNAQGVNISMSGASGAQSCMSANNSSVSSNVTNFDLGLNAASATGTNARFNHGGSGGINLELNSSGATGSRDILRIKNSSTATTDNGGVILFNNARTSGGATEVASVEGRITDIGNTQYKGALIFKTANNASPAERVRINHLGYLGVNGYNNPGYPIDYGTNQGDLAIGRNNNSNYTVHLGISGPNPSFGTNQADTAIYFNQINSNGSGTIDFVTSNSGVDSDIRMTVAKDGAIRMRKYTAGVSQFDSTGNITSTAPGTSGNVLTSSGGAWVSAAAPSPTVPTKQILTSGTTYTTPANAKLLKITVIGGGAGGGGCVATPAATDTAVGGSGGAGGTSIIWISNPSASYSYTIGAGGAGGGAGANNGGDGTASTFNAGAVSAGGGLHGNGNGIPGAVAPIKGGAGGTSSGGDINITGGAANAGLATNNGIYMISGSGGSSTLGGGGPGVGQSTTSAGAAGGLYGGGGSGGASNNAGAGTAQPGGAGAAGVIIVEEHY